MTCPFHLVDPGTLGPAAALGCGPLIRRTSSVDHLGSARSYRGIGSSVPRRTHRPAAVDVVEQPADRSLRRLPAVAMMEAAGHGRLDDLAFVKALHRSWLRGVLRQGKVGPGTVVVEEVVTQQAAQMGFVQHHDVVEALAAEGADEPFRVRILPRRPRRRLDFMDPHGLDSARERDPVHRIAIAQEVSRGSLPGERLHELLGCPTE